MATRANPPRDVLDGDALLLVDQGSGRIDQPRGRARPDGKHDLHRREVLDVTAERVLAVAIIALGCWFAASVLFALIWIIVARAWQRGRPRS